ncbi:Hypothetical protein, predicted lipoprotein [Metamycoplasma auris 15026]|uniref:Variable surface lipoprotein n=1 Tax=Metamycoplasma auris 15026 TaxID=1188233 RepID=N9V0B8_9BACT|nr:variable surface lipoprotein [Metamycoplasma auris]ENY68867.1 Hypothetical protein, predicted lipoprotein [Metamycoplasma auris 15026]
MKKINKFLLALGSVASLASMPLIAANCGGNDKTKDDKSENKDKDGDGNKNPETDNKTDEQKFTEASDKAIKTLNDLKEKVNKYEFDAEKAKKSETLKDAKEENHKEYKKQITDRIDQLVKQIESWKTSGPKNIDEVNLAKGEHKTYDEAYDAMIKKQLGDAIKKIESISKDVK